MTEQDYVDATNLAYIVSALHGARQCVFLDDPNKTDLQTACVLLREIEERLYAKIKVET